jgi:hypothetical protein
MLRRVALVRTDVSEELIASITRVTRIGSSETSVFTRAIRLVLKRVSWCSITEDGIL